MKLKNQKFYKNVNSRLPHFKSHYNNKGGQQAMLSSSKKFLRSFIMQNEEYLKNQGKPRKSSLL